MNSKKAIKLLKATLKNAQSSGEFSVSGEAAELPVLTNLHVKNVGFVSLPLYDSQAKNLIKVNYFDALFNAIKFLINISIKVCAQAPFGRDQLTLVDKNVRDSYQLDPSQIEIKHPDWTRQLNLLVERIAKNGLFKLKY